MNSAVDSVKQAAAPIVNRSTDHENREMHDEMQVKRQKDRVSYDYEGYQVHMHFSGNRTMAQCIRNLIARKNSS